MNSIDIKQGSELSQDEIKAINHHRKIEFDGEPTEKEEGFKDHIFFLLKNNQKLLAFGRLRPLEVTYQGGKYPILGLASIVATDKSKGYGKELVTNIKKHLEESGLTGIGFCDPKVSGFYIKCGYKIIKECGARFIYEENGKVIPEDKLSDVVYFDGENKLGSSVESSSDMVYIPYPHW